MVNKDWILSLTATVVADSFTGGGWAGGESIGAGGRGRTESDRPGRRQRQGGERRQRDA